MTEKKSHVRVIVIVISLLLHAAVLILLLMIYQDTHADFSLITAPRDIETVFYDQPTLIDSKALPSEPPDQTWAQLKPMASSLGKSMEMPDVPEDINNISPIIASISDLSGMGGDINDNLLHKEENIQAEQEVTAPTDTRMSLDTFSVAALSDFANIAKEQTPLKKTDLKNSSLKQKQLQAQKIISAITSGYLEQLHHEGDNLIKTIGGDPNKSPTQEQLKYERYIAKIQWCLQNAHSILQEKCQLGQPLQATMKVFLQLEKTGAMTNLRIVQSSGNEFADSYILSLFEYASRSFPPLPAYITLDPFPLHYTVFINWNLKSNFNMGIAQNF